MSVDKLLNTLRKRRIIEQREAEEQRERDGDLARLLKAFYDWLEPTISMGLIRIERKPLKASPDAPTNPGLIIHAGTIRIRVESSPDARIVYLYAPHGHTILTCEDHTWYLLACAPDEEDQHTPLSQDVLADILVRLIPNPDEQPQVLS